VKPLPDKRQYRSIRLGSNLLQVLLISDPNTDTEAAAVHLRSGHFHDPINRAGLAHFHEHCLFLGTNKYPAENEYESYLNKHGGYSNAYTDMEDVSSPF
jgi:insulysin